MRSSKQWNPKYLSGCAQYALELLPRKGLATDLFLEAIEHLECTVTNDCRLYRRQLRGQVDRLRRIRRIEPWEYWLLQAAEKILSPIPGVKHGAVSLLGSAIGEYDNPMGDTDSGLRNAWWKWHDQHATKEPAYV
jgi:hypothetical protein